MEKGKLLKLNIQLFAEGDPEPAKDPTVEALLEEISSLKLATVPKEQYEKMLEDNKKLVKQITEERPAPKGGNAPTKQDIVKRIEERVAKTGQGNSLDNITLLIENYRDMQALGLDTEHVDAKTVEKLEEMVKEAAGDPIRFNSLMESRVKISK